VSGYDTHHNDPKQLQVWYRIQSNIYITLSEVVVRCIPAKCVAVTVCEHEPMCSVESAKGSIPVPIFQSATKSLMVLSSFPKVSIKNLVSSASSGSPTWFTETESLDSSQEEVSDPQDEAWSVVLASELLVSQSSLPV
jgi:hypothetical protein